MINFLKSLMRDKAPKISASDALSLMKNDKSLKLIDVRTRPEHNENSIPKSINIPLDTIEESIENKIPDKNTKIIVYCHSGARSAKAASILVQKGYTDVHDLGGLASWPYKTTNN